MAKHTIKSRSGETRMGVIIGEHIDTSGQEWVSVLYDNDDVETILRVNITGTIEFCSDCKDLGCPKCTELWDMKYLP